MEKYILHGGDTRRGVESNVEFFREIVRGVGDDEYVLFCYFAKDDVEAEVAFVRDSGRMSEIGFGGNVVMADREKFLEQVKNAAAVYFCGGDIERMFASMERYENIKELLLGCRTLAGSSAGTYLLCGEFFYRHRGEWVRGLGIVAERAYCHYDGSDVGGDVMCLRECEFEVKYSHAK